MDPVSKILGFNPKDRVRLDRSKNAVYVTYAPTRTPERKPEPQRPVVYTTVGRVVPPRRWF
jgi:hypothetical protein